MQSHSPVLTMAPRRVYVTPFFVPTKCREDETDDSCHLRVPCDWQYIMAVRLIDVLRTIGYQNRSGFLQ